MQLLTSDIKPLIVYGERGERERENGVQEGEGERVGNQGYVGYTCQCLLLLHCNGETVAIHWLHIHVLNCGLVC